MITIAFDVDGTLKDEHDNARHGVLTLLHLLSKIPDVEITVWSGGGKDYAESWVGRLGLKKVVHYITEKPKGGKYDSEKIHDICFDDQKVDLARVNIHVPTKEVL